ncbi:MAG: hypothetical protein PHR44_01095 [Candidatus Omnitrophica bacterium]|nr:hypothetical protein [Candidatus Omnitrophota bacterium]
MELIASLFEPGIFLLIAGGLLGLSGFVVFMIIRERSMQRIEIESQQDHLKELEIAIEEETQRKTKDISAKLESLENEVREKAAFKLKAEELQAELDKSQGEMAKLEAALKEKAASPDKAAGKTALQGELEKERDTLKKELAGAREEVRQARQDLANAKEMYEDLKLQFEDLKEKAPQAEEKAPGEEKPRVVSPETSSKILEALRELKQSEQKKPPEEKNTEENK